MLLITGSECHGRTAVVGARVSSVGLVDGKVRLQVGEAAPTVTWDTGRGGSNNRAIKGFVTLKIETRESWAAIVRGLAGLFFFDALVARPFKTPSSPQQSSRFSHAFSRGLHNSIVAVHLPMRSRHRGLRTLRSSCPHPFASSWCPVLCVSR